MERRETSEGEAGDVYLRKITFTVLLKFLCLHCECKGSEDLELADCVRVVAASLASIEKDSLWVVYLSINCPRNFS